MSADVSRVRFDPRRNFAGVALQQGRLLLDADFNEYVALLDRRLRAEACDLTSFGPDPDRAGVAWVPRQTPDAFRVTAAGGALTIGRGRMYVDGLLAENHGGTPAGFDPLLAGPTGTTGVAYDDQPYWPTPDPLPAGGPHLAYLDVWQREVTHVEDPGLVEVAVGVDTTARWQTVWQVRLLAGIGTATCASDDEDIPGWLDVIRPSAGRLTTGTVAVDPDDDPCQLPPTGGYRGLENQTYRVEVHAGGPPGTATFKWSRDNGSVTLPVVEMVSTTVLRLASVGRDDVLRVSTGDWVEILDDHFELGGKPGVIRKVTVDDAARTVTFAGALPTELRPADAADAAARHLRVRRWDQSGVVRDGTGAVLVDLDQPGASGLVTVPAAAGTQVVLEHGVAVSFSVAAPGGRFRPGDHWVFAARTADSSVEELLAAPPLGVHHHYARLGVVTFPDAETDCRRLWPPLEGGDQCGDCTVCVTPDSHASGALTVQMAIDQVKDAGGTVCLAAGTYDLGDGVTVDGGRSVRVRGQGPATLLTARGTALTVERSLAVTVEDLAVVSGSAGPAGVRLRAVGGATLQRLVVLSLATDATGGQQGGAAVELSGAALGVRLRDNVLVGRAGVDTGGGDKLGLLAGGLRVEGNLVVAADRGIDLGGLAAYLVSCRVTGNEVLAGRGGGVLATGAVAPGGSLEVAANRIATTGAGITVGPDAAVDANTVNGRLLQGRAQDGTDGIVVAAGGLPAAPGHVRITGNRVHDRDGTGIAVRAPVRTLLVKQNVVAGVGAAGIALEGQGRADQVAIEDNQVLDVATTGAAKDSAAGIRVGRAGRVAIAGNDVVNVAPTLVEGRARAGILVLASGDVRVSGNLVDRVGPPGAFVGLAAGVLAAGPFDRVVAAENSSRFGPGEQGRPDARWHALLVQSPGRGEQRVGRAAAVVPLGRGGAFVVNGAWGFTAPARPDHVTVSANALRGGGQTATCLVRVGGDVVADANQCDHLAPSEPPAMVLGGGTVTASANRVRGEKAMIVLETQENRFAAVANISGGGTHLGGPGAGLPGPWGPLNPLVP